MMNYTTLLDKDSMYNTPPCWCIYMTGLVMDYLQNEVGGLEEMAKINHAKAKVLYDYPVSYTHLNLSYSANKNPRICVRYAGFWFI